MIIICYASNDRLIYLLQYLLFKPNKYYLQGPKHLNSKSSQLVQPNYFCDKHKNLPERAALFP